MPTSCLAHLKIQLEVPYFLVTASFIVVSLSAFALQLDMPGTTIPDTNSSILNDNPHHVWHPLSRRKTISYNFHYVKFSLREST